MANIQHSKSALSGTTRTNNISRGREYYQAVVYDDFSGFPLSVSFLGNRWWVTSPSMKLQPLEDYFEGEDIGFDYLCEAGGTVGALALARMLGLALTNPEDRVDECMRNRVAALKRLGVTLDVKDEALALELEVYSNEGSRTRQGDYSVKCHLAGNYFEQLFDIDAFDSKKGAEEWAGYFFDILEELSVSFTVV